MPHPFRGSTLDRLDEPVSPRTRLLRSLLLCGAVVWTPVLWQGATRVAATPRSAWPALLQGVALDVPAGIDLEATLIGPGQQTARISGIACQTGDVIHVGHRRLQVASLAAGRAVVSEGLADYVLELPVSQSEAPSHDPG